LKRWKRGINETGAAVAQGPSALFNLLRGERILAGNLRQQSLRDMCWLCRMIQKTWQRRLCRGLVGVICAALAGIATGHTVIASVSGSVSVVNGVSMAPTFRPGTRVYTAPITAPLERGDIVLLDDGREDYALKRIVGMPGEVVHLWRGCVFINRKMLRELYLPKHTYTFPDERTETFVFELGQDQYFVLGDNRDCSSDSRAYGPVDRKHIKSRVPSPGAASRARFTGYTLPSAGQRAIQPLSATPPA
jgi:signal peptidase I